MFEPGFTGFAGEADFKSALAWVVVINSDQQGKPTSVFVINNDKNEAFVKTI